MLFLLLFFVSHVFSRVYALPRKERSLLTQQAVVTDLPGASALANHAKTLWGRSVRMDETVASYTEQGLCFHYFAERPSWYPDPCIEYCKKHGGHGYDGVSTTSTPPTLSTNRSHSVMLAHMQTSISRTVTRASLKPMTTVSAGSQLPANALIPKWRR